MPEPDALAVWVVYDRPLDCPTGIIVRRQWAWSWCWPDPQRRVTCIGHDAEARQLPSLGVAHGWLRSMGLTRMDRMPGDDPVIAETWI